MVTTAILWILLGVAPSEPLIDFIYLDRDQPAVTFSLHGSCVKPGISFNPADGLIIDRVEANGRDVERGHFDTIIHDPYTVNINPGPSFFYLLPIKELQSVEATELSRLGIVAQHGVAFFVKGLPKTLKITYRIRCADGTASRAYVTRGKKYPLPKKWPLDHPLPQQPLLPNHPILLPDMTKPLPEPSPKDYEEPFGPPRDASAR
jgi:hypothetical protein